jgi:hypothetical protein
MQTFYVFIGHMCPPDELAGTTMALGFSSELHCASRVVQVVKPNTPHAASTLTRLNRPTP